MFAKELNGHQKLHLAKQKRKALAHNDAICDMSIYDVEHG